MFKIAICDDVKAICDEVKYVILNAEKNIVHEEIDVNIFYSGDSLITELREGHKYDLIFLDIELGSKINGVNIGHVIRSEMDDYITQIIYISSKSTYDRQLFDVKPLHFLQKPLDHKRIIQDIKLAIKLSEKGNKLFEFKSFRSVMKVPYRDILYFESRGREIDLVCYKEKYTFYDSMQNLIKTLPDFFIYPHRSYLVNYELVRCFKFEELIMSNGDIIPISRNRRNEIRDLQALFERELLQ